MSILRPASLCPKCGYAYGFRDTAPQYVGQNAYMECARHSYMREHLHWNCGNCGYLVTTPCADAEVPVQPEPVRWMDFDNSGTAAIHCTCGQSTSVGSMVCLLHGITVS